MQDRKCLDSASQLQIATGNRVIPAALHLCPDPRGVALLFPDLQNPNSDCEDLVKAFHVEGLGALLLNFDQSSNPPNGRLPVPDKSNVQNVNRIQRIIRRVLFPLPVGIYAAGQWVSSVLESLRTADPLAGAVALHFHPGQEIFPPLEEVSVPLCLIYPAETSEVEHLRGEALRQLTGRVRVSVCPENALEAAMEMSACWLALHLRKERSTGRPGKSQAVERIGEQ